MKYLLILLLQLFTVTAIAQTTQKVIYTCPMHPEVRMDKAGKCPKCGMSLEKKTIRVAAAKPKPATKPKAAVKAPPTRPSNAAVKNNVTQKDSTVKRSMPATTTTEYTCPMHPEVISNKPGSCPKCGMYLVKKNTASNQHAHDSTHAMPGTTIYTCAMHPEVISDKPGNCPKCGMSLVKKEGSANQHMHDSTHANPATTAVFTCPMHPEVTSDKPGKCPKCGMSLEKKEGSGNQHMHDSTHASPATSAVFTCPMHREVTSDKPGNCPKCGMRLEKKVSATPGVYSCPMHPEVKSATPGNCPKCGMRLVQQTQGTSANAVEDDSHPFIAERVNLTAGKTIVHHLYVTDTIVNYTGKNKHAYAINGKIPAPPLIFTEGDTAEIYLHNMLKNEETSLHWHGVILPNWFDGVPYLTTKRIGPGETHLYKFKIVQNGTYWYHSHSGLQEQAGMYGALIFKKREQVEDGNDAHAAHNSTSNKDYSLVLSEWTDERPEEVQRKLRSANDWYAIKKGSVQSYSEAIRAGHFGTKLLNEWKRMKAMDVSDVYYDRFLSNGLPEKEAPEFKAGDKVRLRVVNAGASSYFWLQFAGGKLTVVGNDGNDVQPVEVDRLIVGVSETYDVVVTIPDNMSYEFRATPEDRTKHTSLWLGSGMKMPAPVLPRLKYFAGMKMMNEMMNTDGTMKDMGMQMSMQKMDMNTVMYPEITGGADDTENTSDTAMQMEGHDMSMHANTISDIVTLNYAMLQAPGISTLPQLPYKELAFSLTGNMNRYVWSINNKTVTEWDKILIEKGQNVRIVLTNNSMMRHPMHLHGHDFRIINGKGEYAPLKNVIDIMPMETDTIEFAANQDGDWFFHCHILYHMMAGMGNVLSYKNSLPNPDLPNKAASWRMFKKDNTMIHSMARVALESKGSEGELMFNNDRYALQTMWHLGLNKHHGYEVEVNFGRFIGVNQWVFPYIGFDYHYKIEEGMDGMEEKTAFGQISNKNNRKAFVAGVQYTLPSMVVADARIDSDLKFRLQLGREDIPVTPRIRAAFFWNSDKEYGGGLRYIVSKWFGISSHYDSDMGLGAGITISY